MASPRDAAGQPPSTPVRFRDLSSRFVGGSSSVMAAAGCCLVASAPVGPAQQSGRGAALVNEAVRRAGPKRCTQRHGKRTQIPATSVFTRALEVRSSQSVSEMAQIATDVNIIINNAASCCRCPAPA